ncbi:hypothetical protein [Dendrosporobacter sp. 1207_IL3150]|uniref:hypothetical protein n=1 Tax=Dendrosporobacter sp. 1207_IL3150 TaxID=3084054 RepID=UPI002FD8A018
MEGYRMGKFEKHVKVGLRDKQSKELIAVYPFPANGDDAEIEKAVRDWYYQQSCEAEDRLLSTYVDVLTENEMRSRGYRKD